MKSYPSFGMVQGRLTPSPKGFLQHFPQEHWQSEFFVARSIGLNFIELLMERQHNPNNPIWNKEGRDAIRSSLEASQTQCYSTCNDFIIDHCLTVQASALDQSLAALEATKELGAKLHVVPLFEASEITSSNWEEFLRPLAAIANAAKKHDIIICLETLLESDLIVSLLDRLGHSNVGVCFDTGNRANLSKSLYDEAIVLGSRINHVHLKDKNANGENVLFGGGNVNFHEVFAALAQIDYGGSYTFEATRGKDPIATAKFHLQFAKFAWEENFIRKPFYGKLR